MLQGPYANPSVSRPVAKV